MAYHGKNGNPALRGKADFIRQYIKEEGANLTDLARMTGLSRSAIFNFVGGAAMNVDYVEAVLNSLNCRLVIEELPEDVEVPIEVED